MRHLAVSAILLAIAASSSLQVPANMDLPPGPVVAPDSYRDGLVVLTRHSVTTRYVNGRGEYAGLENDLAELFARELKVPVRFVVAHSYGEVLTRLERGEAHLAAASLVATPDLHSAFTFGPGYMRVRQILIRRKDVRNPRSIEALGDKQVVVTAQSSGEEALDAALRKAPDLNVDIMHARQPEAVTKWLAAGEAEFGVIGSHVFDQLRAAMPQLRMAMSLDKPQQLAWAFPRDADPDLVKAAKRFFAKISKDGTLDQLIDRYYGQVNRLSDLQIDAFLDDCQTRLSAYRDTFLEAQKQTGVDWRLIAALGYQESKWDPVATSPTGVQGFMMLTSDTAERMGVKNKLDPRESILAGARYLRTLRDTLPDRIEEPDRTWLALAAYNQGLGHLEDARILAQRMGLDPDVWIDVRRALPLLANPDYNWELRYGYARGGEAVALAENVRAFYHILVQIMPRDDASGGLLQARSQDDSDERPERQVSGFLL
ncbi:MAG: membrane-bound lytic murein transglycosylase MltF [Betaproteobacteria bacterium]|nr:membrane-bound lytic murein transglycosylase MltF [Betaproteobacteria bacterium]